MEAALPGTNLDETDFMRGTPLHIAVSQGDAETAKILIRVGADIEAPSELSEVRAIHIAASLGESALVELLLAAGASRPIYQTTCEIRWAASAALNTHPS